jgi:hypothetical protein
MIHACSLAFASPEGLAQDCLCAHSHLITTVCDTGFPRFLGLVSLTRNGRSVSFQNSARAWLFSVTLGVENRFRARKYLHSTHAPAAFDACLGGKYHGDLPMECTSPTGVYVFPVGFALPHVVDSM